MKKTRRIKARKHSEIWYMVHNSVRFALMIGEGYHHGERGLLIGERKKDLKAYSTRPQRVVKVRITEL